ncbi:hypothetical protein [Pedobacter sp. B4-66]|uniref:hypothetical protein n=1 Tax=Pedobacter sp. B4-66 TaxID=2817280 RepID=UPI001BD94D51|nr:hypothetical protein [Pedobacter sp. B4-66]
MKILTSTISVLLLFSIGFSSCKKNKNVQPENPINGNWEEMGLDGLKRSVNFTKHNTFFLTIAYNDGASSKFIGTYQVKGDKLNVTITENLEQKLGKPVERISTNYALYEKATFSVAGDTLKLNYISYPADAPVNTLAKFRRLTTIDGGGLTQ